VPGWAEEIEQDCFGRPWGPLDEDEHLWVVPAAGFARWRVVPQLEEAELLRLAVAAPLRRRGVGVALLRHCQSELARMGVPVLFLEVRVTNAGARALYEREGWRYQGLREAYYRDGEDAAIYRYGP
jgi:ribosomal-protein-alanine N-acetyltransferase